MIQVTSGPEVAQWVGARLGIADFGPNVAFGFVRNGEPLAGVVFNQYRHPTIEATIAASHPSWATRSTLRLIFTYPFEQAGVSTLLATTAKKNRQARRFLTRLGFTEVGPIPKGMADGQDAILHTMTREQAERWLA